MVVLAHSLGLGLALSLLVLGVRPAPSTSTSTSSLLSFQISSGGNENFFYRDNQTSAQVLLTSPNNTASARRFIAALPAGNIGALVYFLPLSSGTDEQGEHLGLTLLNDTLTSTADELDNVGIQADLLFSRNATLGVTIVGAVRAMRDYVEGGGTMNSVFNYTLGEFNETSVWLRHRYINASSSSNQTQNYKYTSLHLSVPSSSPARFSVTPNTTVNGAPTINIYSSTQDTDFQVRIRVLSNETSLVGLNPSTLFLTEGDATTPGVLVALQRLRNGSSGLADAAQQVSFLTYEEKFTAGGWRFLTYFGRDTLIALRLLMPIMTSESIESVLSAVIERANSTGALCHEETIGDYASFVNIQNHQPELGNEPFYDYKMIDTGLLLFPALAHYFLDLPQGQNRQSQFLARNATLQNGTYAEILERISTYNYARALPFHANQSYNNLLSLRPGQPVGNWRDSNEGLGFGLYPFDVNTALVPASLRAVERLIEEEILSAPIFHVEESQVAVGSVAKSWEENTLQFFEVEVAGEEAERRLKNFVNNPSVNLGEGILSKVGGENETTRFYALSLKEDGSPVEVLNSDISFNLMYSSNVSKELLEHVVNVLRPYPRGLLTNIGMVVANPAFDSNTTNIGILDRRAYHGTVVWSFQQGLMAGGLARQLNLCGMNSSIVMEVDINPVPPSVPSWCSDTQFLQALSDAEKRLWTSIEGASENLFTEVWTYAFNNGTNEFTVADLASLSPSGTESDAIQLWSYGFLGLVKE
ncbi:hypothetical protein K435DRAFT_728809 [Dendrothele bispora CBS 962.96]|uniref:Glycogen debranching enzyme n=1 Tax=Dendrothele bispora (strain CBS 962.96) TaxID=1314807 RepID=A0A4S8LKK0_DENBC|nr:hypothetical protein K435DRAFT_728809 [Dendrothele bispora CBS 962.96]